MAKVDLPSGSGIYFIRVGNYGYVGQTVDFNERLGSHIRSAYYGNDSGSAQKMYWKMKIHRIQDIEILLYPAAQNFGIPGFQEKFTNFLSEWAPAGKRVSQDSAVTDESLRLDFAEIYHILYHLKAKDCVLTNIEVGGQVSGWTSKQKPSESILGTSKKPIKLITRQTPPSEAYQTFLRGAVQSLNLAELTEQIYNDLFDKRWATILNEKYLPIAREFDSSTDVKRLISSLNKLKLKSWSKFFEEDCLPEIVKNIPNWTIKSMEQQGVKTITSIRSVAIEDISAYVIKNFLEPRQEIAQKMLEWLFQDSGQTPATALNMVDHFDFTQLGDYIADVVSQLIVRVGQSIQTTNNKANLTLKKNFKPVRFSVVWKSRLHKNTSHTSWLLNDFNITSGDVVSEDWLRYRSLLMFDYFMNKTKKLHQVEPIFSRTIEGYYIPMHYLEPSEWLSTRLHSVYSEFAPGYDSNWFEFYRPMVSLWRNEKHRPNFDVVSTENNEYIYYNAKDKDALVTYSRIKNFIFDIDSWNQLTIY